MARGVVPKRGFAPGAVPTRGPQARVPSRAPQAQSPRAEEGTQADHSASHSAACTQRVVRARRRVGNFGASKGTGVSKLGLRAVLGLLGLRVELGLRAELALLAMFGLHAELGLRAESGLRAELSLHAGRGLLRAELGLRHSDLRFGGAHGCVFQSFFFLRILFWKGVWPSGASCWHSQFSLPVTAVRTHVRDRLGPGLQPRKSRRMCVCSVGRPLKEELIAHPTAVGHARMSVSQSDKSVCSSFFYGSILASTIHPVAIHPNT